MQIKKSVVLGGLAALAAVALIDGTYAAVFQCVDASGTRTYSDQPCAPAVPPPEAGSKGGALAAPAPMSPAEHAREAKALEILQLLRITSSANSDAEFAQRTVDLIAPDLVKQLDPANPAWTPQQPKWHPVLDFVKSDLRRDVQGALRVSSMRTGQATAHEYASRAQDADMDALLRYLHSPEGVRYIAFQDVLGTVAAQAMDSLMAEEPISAAQPAEDTLKRRLQVLSLGVDARIAADGGGPARSASAPGSPAIIENTARREGNALDTLYNEYQDSIPGFIAFTQSVAAKHFFAACEPALRVNRAESSIAAAEFADNELSNYGPRWRSYYGPPVRGNGRLTTIVRSGPVGVVSTRQVVYDGGVMAREAAALQCEQREDAAYQRIHPRTSEINSQAAHRDVQNSCRSEQGLPAL